VHPMVVAKRRKDLRGLRTLHLMDTSVYVTRGHRASKIDRRQPQEVNKAAKWEGNFFAFDLHFAAEDMA
jgi:hypothetical protein